MKFYQHFNMLLISVTMSFSCTTTEPMVKKIRIPFKSPIRFNVLQGAFGNRSHQEKGNEFSWDLGVPLNTEVVSVEDGTVLEVWQPNLSGECSEIYSQKAHNIKIEHKDQTVAQYVHIQTWLSVGEQVKKGQVVAKTAHNGWICEPHLHFGIYKSKHHLYSSSQRQTIPLFFSDIKQGKLEEGVFIDYNPIVQID